MIKEILLFLFAPIFIVDHYLSYLWIYRRIWGGHWERWTIGEPCHGEMWVRIKRDDCYRMTGKHPGGLHRGAPYCEEKGTFAYDGAAYCECGRDLYRAPGVAGAPEKDQPVVVYSCPCGRWPRFLFDAPVPIYLGDQRTV